jgi:thymidylate synthase (FAD)
MEKFKLELLRCTPNPQQLVWLAMHQDYSEDFVIERIEKTPNEQKCGELIVQKLLGHSHYGPFEHPQITLNAGYFPHSVMQQIRTHRVGISMDVQSGRYTSQRILDVCSNLRTVEDVFYLRPVGNYTDRKGKKYYYSDDDREADKNWCLQACFVYKDKIEDGHAEEHARGVIPFDIRQHFVISLNARSLMHILDMRSPLDAQLECQNFSELLMAKFTEWMPEVANWYQEKRYKKSRLSP